MILLLFFFLLILIIEIPALLAQKQYKELGVFMIFFSISVYMGLAYILHWPLSGPFEAFTAFMERLTSV